MKNPFSMMFRARDKPENAVSNAPSVFFGSALSSKSVSALSAMQMSAVYACVRVIAETVASLPLNVFEITDEGSKKAYDHPLQRLLHDEPNHEMTSFIWRESGVGGHGFPEFLQIVLKNPALSVPHHCFRRYDACINPKLSHIRLMVHWFCILFGNKFTPDEVYDNYPNDRLVHDLALALMAVQTQTTEVLDAFPTKPTVTEKQTMQET